MSQSIYKTASFQQFMLTRREFLDNAVKLGVGGLLYATLSAVPEKVWGAPEPSPSELDRNFILTREQFNEFLRRPVRETLSSTRVEFVGIDEYENALQQRSLTNVQAPVISLIYDDAEWSRGLAALVYTFDQRYANLRQLGVCYSTSQTPSRSEGAQAFRRLPLQSLPGLLFYRNEGGRCNRIEQMDGGIREYEGRGSYVRNIELICPFIEAQLILR